jgi:hypothetical protein
VSDDIELIRDIVAARRDGTFTRETVCVLLDALDEARAAARREPACRAARAIQLAQYERRYAIAPYAVPSWVLKDVRELIEMVRDADRGK